MALPLLSLTAQDESPSPAPSISSGGGKNRISFSYEKPVKASTPSQSPVASPAPSPAQTQKSPAVTNPTPAMAPQANSATNVPASVPSKPALTTPNTPPSVSGDKADANLIKQFLEGEKPETTAAAPADNTKPETPQGAATPEESAANSPKHVDEAINAINEKPLVVKSGAPASTGAPASSATKTDGDEATPTQSVTVNLIQKLVQRGVLSKGDANTMIKQAEAEAEAVREQNQSDMFAIAQTAAVQVVSDQSMVAQSGNTSSEEDIKVTYIPEPVKTQIREDIKHELMTDARAGRLAFGPQPAIPEWVARIHPFADFRFRYEGIYYPDGNDDTGAFPNFNAINTGAPFDTTGIQFAPQYNVNQNRNRFRLRARFGAEMDLTQNFSGGLRISTGETNSPVTPNQTVGVANQTQGGQFSRYAIWLDRAYVKYVLGNKLTKNITLWLGRFDNPFFSTKLIWYDDLGFDGIAMQATYEVVKGVIPFFTAGAFPIFNTDLNFSSNQPQKFASYDKYLYGLQGGLAWKPNNKWEGKIATALYYFQNVEGKLSTPFTPLTPADAGDTDNSRPSFAQKGNTYMALRDIIPDASNNFGTINQWQYYGLATPFHELAFTGRIDYSGFEPVMVSLVGEFVDNLAFNANAINAVAVNNRGADDTLNNTIGAFEGSSTAWLIDLKIGYPEMTKLWAWNVSFGYRYIGSDSVVDGFNDSDFGLGGTNMKGFTVGAALGLSSNVWIDARWMGSNSIAGPQFNTNIFQFDFHSRF